MNDNNKQIIIEKIWDDPTRVLNGEWVQRGKRWQTRKGEITLLRSASGNNITVFGNHNSGFGGERFDIFTYLQERVLNTSDFWETLRRCADIYGVEVKLSKEQKERIERERLAREVVPSLISALMENKAGETWQYLTETRGITPDGRHYGELTAESLNRAIGCLKQKNYEYNPDDLKKLFGLSDTGKTIERDIIQRGYNVVIPYYRNGAVVGLLLRNIKGNTPKYLFSADVERGGYCDQLTNGKPAVVVEGELDALRLMSAGVGNVIAMGNAGLSENAARNLRTRNIEKITYIPDLEYKEGVQRTNLIENAIKRFQALQVDGEQVIKTLYVGEFPTPEGATLSDYKMDADTYGKENGGDALRHVVNSAREWWDYELLNLEFWEMKERETGRFERWEFERRFMDIYSRCTNPLERERLRGNIEGVELYRDCGITRAALLDVDERNGRDIYADRIKAGADELTQAIKNGTNPTVISGILARMSEAQNINTRADWDGQLNSTWEDELNEIKEQPDTLRTKWELGNIIKNNKFAHYEQIEFYPADITVFVAPTSHGKTMILFQAVLDLLKEYPDKTFLYISCEENHRQLLERSLNAFIDIPTTDSGRDNVQRACFITGMRKRSIKAVLRDERPIKYNNNPQTWEELRARVLEGLSRYQTDIHARLKLIHTEGNVESITDNIRHTIAEYQNNGVEIGGVFVDYMQLLTSGGSSYSRHDELKDICKALKNCAANTELPIIIAAQLNRNALSEGIDSITMANIGEGADIERIAHDVYLLWQVDKTKRDLYFTTPTPTKAEPNPQERFRPLGDRSRRIFSHLDGELKTGHLYIEQMKARDGKTDGWGLFPFDGERGRIEENNEEKMKE